jgi:hypothetical protein
MAKQTKAYKKKAIKSKKIKDLKDKLDFFDRLNKFFDRYLKAIFWITLAIAFIISMFLFDTKVSIGGDDSEYIIGAKKFMEGVKFPTWHGSFYPMFLSFFMMIFGVNVVAFKILSIPLMLGQHFLIFQTFKNRIPSFLLAMVLLALSINGHLLYFSSSTYSEALFFFLQALLIYFFFILDDKLRISASIKSTWKNWLAFGFVMFLLFLTRNIGLGVIISVVLYFLINKNWLPAVYTIASFLVFQLPFTLYKSVRWGLVGTGAESQFNTMFYKHAYDRSQGTEDLIGFITRFWDNSMLYLSKHLYIELGLLSIGSIEKSGFLVILTYLLFFVAFVYIYKKHKQLVFLGIYLAVMLGATFVSQQAHWDQYRLVLIFIPQILVFFVYGMYLLFKTQYVKMFQVFLIAYLFVMPLFMLGHTIPLIRANTPTLKKNMDGNTLYGFTPDWVNYISMCQHVEKTLPDSVGVACRKPNIASIYSEGRDFFGIYRLPSQDPDTLLNYLEVNNIDYVIIGSLRTVPKMKTDRTITTIRNYLYFIQQKYPRIFSQVHSVGKDEGAVLVKILWENKSFTADPALKPKDNQ